MGDVSPNTLMVIETVEPLSTLPHPSCCPLCPYGPLLSSFRDYPCAAAALCVRCYWLTVATGSTCTRMNKPDCDYRMKQPTKSKKKKTTVVERRASIGTKRPVEPPQLTSGGDMVAPPRGRSKSGVTRVLSLKRCDMDDCFLHGALQPPRNTSVELVHLMCHQAIGSA